MPTVGASPSTRWKRSKNLLALFGQGEHLVLVLAHGQALEEHRGDLALELSGGPALLDGFDLIKRAGLRIVDLHQDEVVAPGEGVREEGRREG